MTSSEDPIIFVVPGDLHLTEPDLINHKAGSWMVDEVNNLIRPDFVQFIGDNVQDATEEQFRLFDDLRGRLTVPHFALVGDHDVKNDPEAFGFRLHMGDTYGSTRLRGIRFLRLDTQQFRPLGLSAGQVEWFRNEVDFAVAMGEQVVIFQHNYPYQIWENYAGPGIDDWRAIVQTRPIMGIFCGHTHYGQVANDGRNVAIATRSIGDPEGGPPGYTLGYLHGDDMASSYRTVQDNGPVVLVTHPRETLFATGPRHVVTGPDRFRVWTRSAIPLKEARGRLDGLEWFPLDQLGRDNWTAPLPGDRLVKGTHDFEVEVIDQVGGWTNQRMDFMVDKTGRYTPVPSTKPRITQTSFC